MNVERILGGDAISVAPRLLGSTLSSTVDGVHTSVVLNELEAYMGADDPASHAFRGTTPRTAPMFEAAGTIYVYLIYGMHFCVNIVTGPPGEAQAVLVRGGTPADGVETMALRRGRTNQLADGPGKLAQALGLTTEYSGQRLGGGVLSLDIAPTQLPFATTPRIGISKAVDRPWRFATETVSGEN